MADEGWTIEVRCPHGILHQGPVAVLRGFLPLEDKCEQAKIERAQRQPSLSRKEKKRFKRLSKSLGSIAQNVDPPPSSETKEPT